MFLVLSAHLCSANLSFRLYCVRLILNPQVCKVKVFLPEESLEVLDLLMKLYDYLSHTEQFSLQRHLILYKLISEGGCSVHNLC